MRNPTSGPVGIFCISTRGFWSIIAVGVTILVAGLLAFHALAAVELIYFQAVPRDGEVRLSWATATETDILAFNVNWSESSSGPYSLLVQLPARNEGSETTYEYTHAGLTNGDVVYYQLYALNSDQSTELLATSSVEVGATPTPTSVTPGATTSPTQGSYPGPATQGPSPTSAAYPGPGPTVTPQPQVTQPGVTGTLVLTPTPSLTPGTPGTDQAVGTPGLTPTLIPVPDVAIIFPTPEAVQSLKSNLRPLALRKPARSTLTAERLVPLGVIAAIWVFLGAWFYVSARKLD